MVTPKPLSARVAILKLQLTQAKHRYVSMSVISGNYKSVRAPLTSLDLGSTHILAPKPHL